MSISDPSTTALRDPAPPPLRGGSPGATVVRLAAFAAAYSLAAWLAGLSQAGPDSVTAVWPASGVVLALLVQSDRRRWRVWLPAVWIVNTVQALVSGLPWLVAIGYSTIDVVEGALAASLLVRTVGAPITLERLEEVVALVGVAAIASNAVTALLGAAVTVAWRGVPFWRTWFTWWMSNGVGMLLVAPLLLAWRDGVARLRDGGRWAAVEVGGLLTTLAVVALLVFPGASRVDPSHGSLPYLVFPWLMWAALRTGPFFATAASMVVSGVAVWHTVRGIGLFATAPDAAAGGILGVQVFVSVAVLSALLPAAVVAERRRAQASLERFRLLSEHASDIMLFCRGEDLRILDGNAAAAAAYGYEPWELSALTLSEIVADEVREGLPARVNRAIRTGAQVESVHRRRDGTTFAVEVSTRAKTVDGQPVLLAVVRDVSERKRAEQHVLRLNRLYAVLSQTSQAIVRIHDEARLFAEVCRVAADVGSFRLAWVGVPDATGDEIRIAAAQGPGIGFLPDGVVRLDPDRDLRGPTSRAAREGRLIVWNDLRLVLTAGDWRDRAIEFGFRAVAAVPLRVKGRVRAVLSMLAAEPGFFDPSEARLLEELGASISFGLESMDHEAMRIAAEEASASAYRRFRVVFEKANDAILLLDDSRVVDGNIRAEALFGSARGQLIDRSASDLFPPMPSDEARPGELFDDRIRTALSGQSQFFEWTCQRPAAPPFDVEVGLSAVELEGRTMLVAMVRDITDRRRLETELRQAQKMEAVGRLAGGIAHDFNNLLQVIRGYADMTIDELPESSPCREYMDGLRKAADRATELTSRLLAFGRKQVMAPVVIDLNQAIADMESMLRRLIGEDIELVTVLAAGVGRVRADQGQLEQVVLNLAVNARDAMPDGGKLTIKTAAVEFGAADRPAHGNLPPGRYAAIVVSDSGSGMPLDVQAHAFEPFFTTKPRGKGTGLGLSSVYGIVRQSGGHVTFTSKVGAGTTFEIYLPTVQDSVEEPPVVVAALVRPGSETILLVEDEGQVRGLVRLLLERLGYTVLEAASGDQAIAIVNGYPAPIHLVLTDVIMPGMAGPEVARRVRALRPDARVLFMSGYTDDSLSPHGMLEADVLFVHKPFAPAVLADKVREALAPRCMTDHDSES